MIYCTCNMFGARLRIMQLVFHFCCFFKWQFLVKSPEEVHPTVQENVRVDDFYLLQEVMQKHHGKNLERKEKLGWEALGKGRWSVCKGKCRRWNWLWNSKEWSKNFHVLRYTQNDLLSWPDYYYSIRLCLKYLVRGCF